MINFTLYTFCVVDAKLYRNYIKNMHFRCSLICFYMSTIRGHAVIIRHENQHHFMLLHFQ